MKFKQGILQLHYTLVLKWERRYCAETKSEFNLVYKNGKIVEPQHMKAEDLKGKGRRADIPQPMFLDVQVQKVGMIFNESNYQPYIDFDVNDKWFKSLLQKGKISTAAMQKDTQKAYSRRGF